jgi:hypothetical protein
VLALASIFLILDFGHVLNSGSAPAFGVYSLMWLAVWFGRDRWALARFPGYRRTFGRTGALPWIIGGFIAGRILGSMFRGRR